MGEVERVIDKFSGMITREQSSDIIKESKKSEVSLKKLLIADDTEYISAADIKKIKDEATVLNESINQLKINIFDTVYRVFNEKIIENAKGVTKFRQVVIGKSDNTMVLNLFGKCSEEFDTKNIIRGDTISATDTVFNFYNENIYSTRKSRLVKELSSKPDFKRDDNSSDISGKIIELEKPKYTDNKFGKTPFSSCVLESSGKNIKVQLWGSSAIASANLSIGDSILIEFCSLGNDAEESAKAGENSRILRLNQNQ